MTTNVKYYVAKIYSMGLSTIVEGFDNETDAQSYAALMSRAKGARYYVLEVKSRWDGAEATK